MNPIPSKPNRWRPITVFNLLVGLLFSLSALGQTINIPGFYIIKGAFNWAEANADAIQRGGHLATITSQSEQNIVAALNNGQSGEYYMLGATDALIEGEWKWVTGESFIYNNWGNGEPNNHVDEDELFILNWASGVWADGNSAGRNSSGYILEIEPQPYQPAFLKEGLVAYYPFNGNANDESSLQSGLEFFGQTEFYPNRFGLVDSAVHFSRGAFAKSTNISNLPFGSQSRTLSLWVKSDDGLNSLWSEHIANWGTAVGSKSFGLMLYRGDKWYTYIYGDDLSSGENADLNWHHLVAVYNQNDKRMQIFVDGKVCSESLVTLNTTATRLFLGIETDLSNDSFFDGSVDDVRIYNRSLSDAEVKALYAYESTPPDNSFITNGLVAYYPFDGNANDASGNGNNGVVTGATFGADKFGQGNSAANFNGQPNNFISVPNNKVINIRNQLSITLWTQIRSGGNENSRLLSKGWSPDAVELIVNGTGNQPKTVSFGGGLGGIGYGVDTVSLIENNNWVNLTFTDNGYIRRVYINGVFNNSFSHNKGVVPTNSFDLVFGKNSQLQSGCFDGLIDDVRIYNRALSDGEIRALYNYESTSPIQSPVFVNQPVSRTVNSGDNVVLSVQLQTVGIYNYQWQLNEQNIAGATASSLAVNNAVAGAYRYRVIVSNTAGTVVSETAVLSVRSPEPYLSDGLVSYITFDTNLNDSALNANKLIASSKVSLAANRFGNVQSALQLDLINSYVTYTTNRLPQKNEDRSYSIWVLKNRDWNTVGGTGWGPILSYVGEWQKGQPWLEAYNNNSGSWVRFVGDVKTNPEAFSTAFVPQSYDSWQNIIITYKSPLLKIYINGVLRSSKNIPQLSSIVTGPLMIGNINSPFPGIVDDFRCYNRELSALEVTSLYDYEKPIDMPQILTHPKDLAVQVNAAAEFCVGMSDNQWYKYQWQMDSKDILDQTNMCLTINSAGSEFNDKRFRVIVSNTQGFVISDPVTLTVVTPQPPAIVTQPVGKTVQEGSNIFFAVIATDQGAIDYQWQFNEQNLPGATSATLNLNGVKLNTAGRYRVLISSPYGVTISDTVTLTVNPNPPPTIVTQPLSRTPAEGTQVSLTVTATGLGNLTYQWQINNQNIPGAASSTLVLSAVRPSANGNYRVIVGNPYGTTISTEASITVVVTDSDSDGLSDYEELLLGTNANKADSDGDGLSDFAEVRTHGSNPLTTDTDGDGYSDGIEVARDGNPNNRSVTPTGALAVFPAVDVEFYTLNGVKYQLEVSTDMAVWTAQGGVVVGNGGSQNHLVRASKATQFWRLKVVQ